MQVIKACDRNRPKLDKVKGGHPRTAFCLSADEIIDDPAIELVAIATQAASHYDLARKSILRGKHVFIDKPFTLSLSEARGLVDLADHRGVSIFVDHTYLFSGAFLAMRGCLHKRALGKIFTYHSNRSDFGRFQKDANAVYHLMYHDVYLLHALFGPQDLSVVNAASASHIVAGIGDTARACLKTSSGVDIYLDASMLAPHKRREIHVSGAGGILTWEDTKPAGKVTWIRKSARFNAKAKRVEYSDRGIKRLRTSPGEPLKNEIDHVVACLLGKERPRNDGRAALKVMETLAAIDKAARRAGSRARS